MTVQNFMASFTLQGIKKLQAAVALRTDKVACHKEAERIINIHSEEDLVLSYEGCICLILFRLVSVLFKVIDYTALSDHSKGF